MQDLEKLNEKDFKKLEKELNKKITKILTNSALKVNDLFKKQGIDLKVKDLNITYETLVE
ncbi:MAG: hypothetical protein MOGMAGMI_00390 [Candidatus Omnitrophica bacterium]|nr:hypothetical protein [Candidatus Omnitrophota bacterium]